MPVLSFLEWISSPLPSNQRNLLFTFSFIGFHRLASSKEPKSFLSFFLFISISSYYRYYLVEFLGIVDSGGEWEDREEGRIERVDGTLSNIVSSVEKRGICKEPRYTHRSPRIKRLSRETIREQLARMIHDGRSGGWTGRGDRGWNGEMQRRDRMVVYIYIYRGWKGLEERSCIYLHHANGSNHKRSL